jgi:hypothetical protein
MLFHCIMECRPVARQRQRNKQKYNSRYQVAATQTSMFLPQQCYITMVSSVLYADKSRGIVQEPRGRGASAVGGRYQKTGEDTGD